MWHQKPLVVITYILEESFESKDVFTDNIFLDIFKAFVDYECRSIVISYLEILFIVIYFNPVFDDFIEVSLKGIDDGNELLMIVFIDMQDILDIDLDEKIAMDIVFLVL